MTEYTARKASDKAVLHSTGFRSRKEVAESLAFLRKDAVHYRADEGMPSDDKVQRFRERLDMAEELAKRLGITEAEISAGRRSGEDRVMRTRQRNEMIERAAWGLVNNDSTDSEILAMNNDPDFAAAAESMARSIREGRAKISAGGRGP